MPFDYACFISYASPKHPLMQAFIEDLTQELENSLDPYFDDAVWIDRNRLNAGHNLEVALARAICRSVCMIIVYSPKYVERSEWCMREYHAMWDLQQRRFAALGNDIEPDRGMIIPLIYRGKPQGLPPEIQSHVHYTDFSTFTSWKPRIRRNRQLVESIEKLAEYVYEWYTTCRQAGIDSLDDCSSFKLPSIDEPPMLEKPPQSFPGREPQR